MLNGPGVMRKYAAVLDGRQRELFNGKEDASTHAKKLAELTQFQSDLRNGTMAQLEEWYQLYKDEVYIAQKRSKK